MSHLSNQGATKSCPAVKPAAVYGGHAVLHRLQLAALVSTILSSAGTLLQADKQSLEAAVQQKAKALAALEARLAATEASVIGIQNR